MCLHLFTLIWGIMLGGSRINYEFYGMPQWRAHKTAASSLIQHGRPAEHHLLPKKLLIKSQLSFCKHFIENKISKLISCESSPRVKDGGQEGKRPKQQRRSLIHTRGADDNLGFHC